MTWWGYRGRQSRPLYPHHWGGLEGPKAPPDLPSKTSLRDAMNNNTNLEYGPVCADELDGLNILLEQALTFPIGDMAPWTAVIGHEHMRAVRRAGRAIAGLSIIPMGHYFGGHSVRAGGITAVGV